MADIVTIGSESSAVSAFWRKSDIWNYGEVLRATLILSDRNITIRQRMSKRETLIR